MGNHPQSLNMYKYSIVYKYREGKDEIEPEYGLKRYEIYYLSAVN